MTAEAGTGSAAFDPFELPDTIQLWTAEDPYPYLAAARRNGPVQREWPLPADLGTADQGGEPWVNVLGHDEVLAVLRDDETYSSTVLAEIMGPMLGHTMVAMDDPEHRAHRALVAPAFRPKLLARWEQDLVRRVLDELADEIVSGVGTAFGNARREVIAQRVRRGDAAIPVDDDADQLDRPALELL